MRGGLSSLFQGRRGFQLPTRLPQASVPVARQELYGFSGFWSSTSRFCFSLLFPSFLSCLSPLPPACPVPTQHRSSFLSRRRLLSHFWFLWGRVCRLALLLFLSLVQLSFSDPKSSVPSHPHCLSSIIASHRITVHFNHRNYTNKQHSYRPSWRPDTRTRTRACFSLSMASG